MDSPDETSKVPAEAAEDETAASDEVVTVVHDEEDLTEEQTYKLLFGEVKVDNFRGLLGIHNNMSDTVRQ